MKRPWIFRVFIAVLLLSLDAQPLAAGTVVIPEGTEVALRLAQPLSLRTARFGAIVELVVTDDVRIGGVVVVPAGARAIGAVQTLFSEVNPRLKVQLTTVKAGATRVPLRGAIHDDTNELPEGRAARAFVAADTTVQVVEDVSIPGPNTPEGKVRVTKGKTVHLMLAAELSSKNVKAGDQIKFLVLNDVVSDGFVVVARGAEAFGTVTEAKAAARAWRRGSLGLKLDRVQLADGTETEIAFEDAAHGGPTNALQGWVGLMQFTQGLALFALPLAPLQHGEQAILPAGTVVDAFIAYGLLLDRNSLHEPTSEIQPRAEGTAFVTVYYRSLPLPVFFAEVWCGSAKLGMLERGTRVRMEIPPGLYRFRAFEDKDATTVRVEPGADVYLRLELNSQLVVGREPDAVFLPVDAEIGRMEITNLTPITDKKFRYPKDLPMEDLLAERPERKK